MIFDKFDISAFITRNIYTILMYDVNIFLLSIYNQLIDNNVKFNEIEYKEIITKELKKYFKKKPVVFSKLNFNFDTSRHCKYIQNSRYCKYIQNSRFTNLKDKENLYFNLPYLISYNFYTYICLRGYYPDPKNLKQTWECDEFVFHANERESVYREDYRYHIKFNKKFYKFFENFDIVNTIKKGIRIKRR